MSEQVVEYKGLPLVAYTDGGARGALQHSGSGLHGYFYEATSVASEAIQSSSAKKDQPTTFGYTDGNNMTVMAEDYRAKAVVPKVYLDGVEVLGSGVSNNVAELKAAIWALQVARSAQSPSLTVLADSEYVVKGVNEYVTRWKAAGWTRQTGQPLANVELWKALDEEIINYKALDYAPTVQFLWTAAHCGNYGNERADQLATRGVFKSKEWEQTPNDASRVFSTLKELVYSPAKGYLNPKADYNRLLAGQHFYFFSNAQEARKTSDGRSIYYMGCQGGDGTLHGKPVSDATYIVAYLKEGDSVVDQLIARAELRDLAGYGRTYMGELSTVLSSRVYSELSGVLWGQYVRSQDKTNDLYLDDTLLVSERNPPYLAWRDEESLSLVRGILDGFIGEQKRKAEAALVVPIPELVRYNRLGHRETAPLGFDLVVTDLSDLFYTPENGKKKNTHKLTEFMGQSTKSVEVTVGFNTTGEVRYAKIPLTVGLDIARRNTLGALLTKNPKLYCVTWRCSEVGFRYATVVTTDDDVAIWCAIHSNLRAIAKNAPSAVPHTPKLDVTPIVETTPVSVKASKKLAEKERAANGG